jgi:outer membrane protein assembly factor BamB
VNAASAASRKFLPALAACLLAHAAVFADDTPAWPQANGPFGNFNPRQYGVKLVEDIAQARQAWVSEFRDLGFAKGSSSGYVNHLADDTTHPGTSSGLIVAAGKVFASSFRPRGGAWPELMPHFQPDKFRALFDDPKKAAAIRRNSALDADDLTVSIDLETGRTVWTAIEEGRGINRYAGKRLQFHGTPVYFNGRVFTLGTTGRVYCYDAATGKKLWEEDRSALVKHAAAVKEKLLKARNDLPDGEGMGASPMVADGVLIVPEFDTPHPDISLRGLDVATGATLWTVPACTSRFATPAVWTHGGKQFVLVATIKGALRLIAPKDGKVLWTVTGLEPVYYPLSPSADHVCVNVKSAHNTTKKEGQSWGRIAAFKLTPEKAEQAWAAPDKPEYWFENHMDICAMRRVLIRDGRVYHSTQGHTLDPAKAAFFFSIFDEATGAVLYTSKPGEFGHASAENPRNNILGQWWLVEDRILNIPDAAHSDRTTLQWITTDPKDIRRLGAAWKPPHHNTTAYEVFIELPYVAGRFLMRNWQGQVVCYDFRK